MLFLGSNQMRSRINYIVLRFFSYIGMPQLAHWFWFDFSNKIDRDQYSSNKENSYPWVDGNRQFFASGKYIHGKKHGEFRRYDADRNPIAVEKYNDGVLYSRAHVRMKKSYIKYS